MRPLFPWPPAPPRRDASAAERAVYRNRIERYEAAYAAWDTATDAHNRWWWQLGRLFLAGRPTYEVPPPCNFLDLDLL